MCPFSKDSPSSWGLSRGLCWAFLSCPGGQLKPSLWWGGIGHWEIGLLLNFMRCIYRVLKGTSVSPSQQTADLSLPTTTGDGRSRGDWSPLLLVLSGGSSWLQLPKEWAKLPLQAGMEVAQVSGCVPSLHPQWLESATAPAAADWNEKQWGQDCSAHASCQCTANQVPPRGTGKVSNAAKQQVGKGDFDWNGFVNLGTSVLVWSCFSQLCSGSGTEHC